MNDIILKILKENYSIENNDGQWIYIDEQGTRNILTDDDILSYENYIKENIADFGYTEADISTQNSNFEENKISSNNDNKMLSAKELMKLEKTKLKEQKKAAKLLKKQQKIEAKKAKKEFEEELIFDQDYNNSLNEFDELSNIGEESVSENINSDVNHIVNENNATSSDEKNMDQSEQITNSNSQLNNEHFENNNNYYGYDYNNEKNSISRIKESCNSEVTMKIANNIEDTQKSISLLRKLFDESK